MVMLKHVSVWLILLWLSETCAFDVVRDPVVDLMSSSDHQEDSSPQTTQEIQQDADGRSADLKLSNFEPLRLGSKPRVLNHHPPVLSKATDLLDKVLANGQTEYRYETGGNMSWVSGEAHAWCRCSNLVTHDVKYAYGLSDSDFSSWLGSSSPTAARYYDSIVNQAALSNKIRFQKVSKVTEIAAGDLLAMKYPDGSSSTGHIVIAAASAQSMTTKSPTASDTTQYSLLILDCAKSGHGSDDTRKMHPNSFGSSGLGRGTMRLYANTDGTVYGYTWSTYSNSRLYPQSERAVAIGRLVVS
jgi:hypothetical protein